ncbi:DMT family transporter [Agromyces larvae]|uniref:DMT family transporter n=1 Tax=Agromyces larvae TaxID=2929802 RepID=A0ABY4C363_9MICO|nr:DMT family transporter [Agromyces larvae]UOE45877.1 DMT family transporter [Agromyces larvae]
MHDHSRHRAPLWAALVAAAAFGALMSVQSRINGELGRRLDDGFTAAAISFGTGLVLLAVALAFSRRGRAGFAGVGRALREGRLSWWMLLGGLAGAFLVLSQGLTAALLGVALFTVAIVAGQTVSGLVIDLIGLGPGGRHPITAPRTIGATLALAAVTVAVSAQLGTGIAIWWVLLPLLAGLGTGWQQAVNGRVRVEAASALTATFLNFASGTAVLVAAALVRIAIAGPPDAFPTEPWLYVGGALGCVFIAGSAVIVRRTGVLLLSLATIAGQLASALALDLLLPVPGRHVDAATVVGTLLAFIAVGIASGRPAFLRLGFRRGS